MLHKCYIYLIKICDILKIRNKSCALRHCSPSNAGKNHKTKGFAVRVRSLNCVAKKQKERNAFDMACYHFTIKTDKHNGTRVDASQHVDYMRREGKYKNIDFEREIKSQKYQGDIIASPSKQASIGRKKHLYRSIYGSIKGNENNIETSANASVETIYVALSLAMKQYGNKLTISGSNEFKAKVIIAAVELELPIQFTDKTLQSEFLKTKKEGEEIERRSRESTDKFSGRVYNGTNSKYSGGQIRKHSFNSNSGSPSSKRRNQLYDMSFRSMAQYTGKTNMLLSTNALDNLGNRQRATNNKLSEGRKSRYSFIQDFGPPPPQRGKQLYELPICPMVQHAGKTDVLLSSNVLDTLGNGQRKTNSKLRWSISSGRRRIAESVVKNILERSNGQISGAEHVDYVNRNERFALRGGCVYHAHQLPNWAEDSPKKFFQAADKYEKRADATRYREIEFALPNELTLDQQKEIIDEFIDHHLRDFYYNYAIHDKIGTMSNGIRNTHVHIMFSERKIDDRERENERGAKEFFSLPNFKQGTGGCKKDRKWNGFDRGKYLCEIRKDFAMIQNDALEKHGFEIRVDHRSLKAQREAALARGDLNLAKFLDRVPEKHIGPEVSLNKEHPDVIDLQKYRIAKEEYRQLLFSADLLESAEEKEILLKHSAVNKDKVTSLSENDLIKNTESDSPLSSLKAELLTAIRENNALKGIVIWNAEAVKLSKEKFLTKEESALFNYANSLEEEKNNLVNFSKELEKPLDYRHEDLEIYNDVQKELNNKITQLTKRITSLKEPMSVISKKLSSKPIKESIQKETRAILVNDKANRAELKKSNEKVEFLATQLQDAIHKKAISLSDGTKVNDKFSAKEIHAALELSYNNLRVESAKSRNKLAGMKHQYISLNRAQTMAKDVFTKGQLKSLREKQQSLKKEEKHLEFARKEYLDVKTSFDLTKKPSWYQDKTSYLAEQRKVENMKLILTQREKELTDLTEISNKNIKTLEDLCESINGREKIAEITNGILLKNKPVADNYHALEMKNSEIREKISETKLLLKNVETQVQTDKGKNISYQVRGGTFSGNLGMQIKTIASAISGNRELGKLVARFEDDHELYEGMDSLDMKLARRAHDMGL